MVCSPTAVYHRISGDMRNWLGTPLCIQKRNAYSASLQSRSKDPHSNQRERATDARKFPQHVIPQTHTMDVTLAALVHTGCHDDTLHTHWQV